MAVGTLQHVVLQEVDRLFALMRRGTRTTAAFPVASHQPCHGERYLSAPARTDPVSLELRYGSPDGPRAPLPA